MVPSLEHYRCISAYIPSTQQIRVCDTVHYFTHDIPFPVVNDIDHIKKAAADILKLLSSPNKNFPFFSTTDEVQNAIHKTTELLQCTTTPTVHEAKQSIKDIHVPTLPPILTAP